MMENMWLQAEDGGSRLLGAESGLELVLARTEGDLNWEVNKMQSRRSQNVSWKVFTALTEPSQLENCFMHSKTLELPKYSYEACFNVKNS